MSKDDFSSHLCSYWIQDEPNNHKGRKEDCVELTSEVGRKGWNDLDCKSQNFFLCEKMIIWSLECESACFLLTVYAFWQMTAY